AAIIAKKEYPLLELSKITSFKLKPEALLETHNKLISLTIEERRTLPGMDSDRVENIVPASIIVQWVMNRLKPEEVWQCSFSLKEGAILQILNSEL
ncbi:MAG TPA: phosphatase, partial [Marinilabiliaceae bacterium]|nr:phosphatase [Marinilabiliaceae bacterium]